MVKQNNKKSKQKKLSFGISSCNTRLNTPKLPQNSTNKSPENTTNKEIDRLDKSDNFSTGFYNHLDTKRLSFQDISENKFKQILNEINSEHISLIKNKSWSCGSKANRYQNKIESPVGIEGGYTKKTSNSSLNTSTLYDVMIELRGTYLAKLRPYQQQKLLSRLNAISLCKCHRIDLATDDYSFRQIPLNKMLKADKEGNYFGYKEHVFTGSNEGEKSNGITHYFGKKESDKFVRVYNHKNQCLRWETEFKGKYSQEVFNQLVSLNQGDLSDEEFDYVVQKTIGGLAVGVIDFRDRSKLKNPNKACKSKTKRFTWYQEFIDKVGENIQIKPEVQNESNRSFKAKFNWLLNSVSKSLAMVYLAFGRSLIWEIIEHGKSKMKESDYKLVEYWKSQSEK